MISDTLSKLESLKKHDAVILAHPECDKNILRHSDHTGSTTSIIKFAYESNIEKFIIAPEPGAIHQMEKESPHVRLNTIEKMVASIETMSPQIILSEDCQFKALTPLEKVLALS